MASLIVVVEDALTETADASYCEQVRDYFAIGTATFVYDPQAQIEAYGGTDLVMVTDAEAKLVFKRDATEQAVRDAVADLLE